MSRDSQAAAAEEAWIEDTAELSFEEFALKYLKVRTKAGKLLPFKLNRSQRLRQRYIDEMKAAGVPVRIIEVKSRQLGCSTHLEGLAFHDTSTRPNRNALVAAHRDKASRRIFKMTKTFYDNLPEEAVPRTRYNNVEFLDFSAPTGRGGGLNSTFEVMTATSTEDARSATYQFLHLSEVAFYYAPRDFFQAVFETMPSLPDTFVYLETTPRGSGDYVHELYNTARVWGDKRLPWQPMKRRKSQINQHSEFYAFFVPWFLNDEYREPLRATPSAFMSSLDEEERSLLRKFPEFEGEPLVTLEGLAWRRTKIASRGAERFKMEYPATDEEAFAHSGTPAFTSEVVNANRAAFGCFCSVCKGRSQKQPEGNDCPPHRFFEVHDGGEPMLGKRWLDYVPVMEEFSADEGGRFSVWEKPKPGHRYLIAADVATGRRSPDDDYAYIVDLATLDQVARWRGKLEMDEYAELLILLARFYNNATLAPESTGLGAGVIAIIVRSGYPFVYRRVQIDSIKAPATVLGWWTGRKTKPAMVSLFSQSLPSLKIRDSIVHAEARSYRQELSAPDGIGNDETTVKFKTPKGRKDDGLMAAMIALAASQQMGGSVGRPRVSSVQTVRQEPQIVEAGALTLEQWADLKTRWNAGQRAGRRRR